MPFALADAYMILRVDSNRLAGDITRAGHKANLTGAGRRAGEQYAGGMRRGLSAVGTALGVVGIAAGAAVVAAAKAATQFQAEMTRVQTQAGASARDVRMLSDAVLKLAPSTQQGPQQLAEGLYHLKSLGMDNVHAMRALKTASDLAAVGGANLEEATSAIGAAWRSGIKGAHDFGQAAGTVNAIIGAGNMRMGDFISALSSGILPAARTFGVSLKGVGAALALMTDEGIPAVDAATRLRMTLSLLGAPSNVAVKQLATIGVSATALANAMRSPGGLVSAVALLKHHLDASGLSAVQQAQVISRAFGGGRSSSAIMTLLNNLETLRKKQVQINNTTSKYGGDVAAQRRTVQAQLAILRSTFETFAIRAGRALLPPLNGVLHWINTKGIPAAERFVQALSGTGPSAPRVFGGGLAERMQGGPAPPRFTGIRERMTGGAYPAPPVSGWQHFLTTVSQVGAVMRRDVGPAFGAVAKWITGTLLPAIRKMWATYGPGFRDLGLAIKSVWGSLRILWRAWAPFIGPVIKAAIVLITLGFRALAAVLRFVVAPLIRGLAVATQLTLRIIRVAFGNFAVNVRSIFRNVRDWWTAATRWIVGQARTALHDALGVFNWLGKHVNIIWDEIQLAALKMVSKILGAFSHIPLIGGQFAKAQRLVNTQIGKIQGDINTLQGKTVHLGVRMTAASNPYGISGRPAAGGLIVGPGGPTDDQAGVFALSNGEWVIRARSAARYGTAAMDAVNQGRAIIMHDGTSMRSRRYGYGRADGGPVGRMAGGGPVEIKAQTDIHPSNAVLRGEIAHIIERYAIAFGKTMFGSGAGIVRDAMRWIGRIPYVWGGTQVPGGADCSGFVQTILGRHGITAPRTSEAQGAWVRRSRPIPGGLAFYTNPQGGTPPGHVAIIGYGGHVISQGGGMGPQYEGLHGPGPLMFTGIPPHGFGRLGAGGLRGGRHGGGNFPVHGGVAEIARSMAAARGWTGPQWRAIEYVEGREAGWNLRARNPSSGAYGIAQFIQGPSEYYRFGGNPRTAVGQVTGFLNYIGQRYGLPTRAAAHERRFNWYARGTKGAAPGWGVVGEAGPELVRFKGGEEILDHFASMRAMLSGASGGSVPGYQHGAPPRSSRLAAVDRFAFGSLTSLTAIHRAMEDLRGLIRRLYEGHSRRWRLEDTRQAWHHLDVMARELHQLRATIASARAYRATVRQNLTGFAALSNVPIVYTGTDGGPLRAGLVGGLGAQLAQIRRFGALMTRLRHAGLSRALLRQVADMGPAGGIEYAQAILSSGAGGIRRLDATERAIRRATGTVSAQTAAAVYDLHGHAFLHGLRRDRAAIDRELGHAGRAFAAEAARWLGVPAPHRRRHRRQFGGPITEPVIGTGVSTGDEWEFHARETVLPAGRHLPAGPLVTIGHYHAHDNADPVLLAQRLSFQITAAGFGG